MTKRRGTQRDERNSRPPPIYPSPSRNVLLLSRGFVRRVVRSSCMQTISSDTKTTQCRSKRNELYLLLSTLFFKENRENIHGEKREGGQEKKGSSACPLSLSACGVLDSLLSRLSRSSRYPETPSRFPSQQVSRGVAAVLFSIGAFLFVNDSFTVIK